jgi:hypothetical protein
VTAARVMAQNMMPIVRAEMTRHPQPPEIAKLQTDLLAQAEKFLAQVKPTREGNIVALKVEGTEAFGPMVASLLLPAISKARGAAQRAQSTNNLKQIALALHNYHDVHKALPAAVMLGPDGKTKHSWRVAILPYIEQENVYKQYRFDEPWDSENNKKVLDHIPPVFQQLLLADGRRRNFPGGSRQEGSQLRGRSRRHEQHDFGRRSRSRHTLDQARGHPL